MNIYDNVSMLGYCPPLLRSVSTDFYTGKYVLETRRTVDHIKSRASGGQSHVSNYAMTSASINQEKGSMSLNEFISKHPEYFKNMREYVLKYWDLRVKNIRNYGQVVYNNIKKTSNIDLLG